MKSVESILNDCLINPLLSTFTPKKTFESNSEDNSRLLRGLYSSRCKQYHSQNCLSFKYPSLFSRSRVFSISDAESSTEYTLDQEHHLELIHLQKQHLILFQSSAGIAVDDIV